VGSASVIRLPVLGSRPQTWAICWSVETVRPVPDGAAVLVMGDELNALRICHRCATPGPVVRAIIVARRRVKISVVSVLANHLALHLHLCLPFAHGCTPRTWRISCSVAMAQHAPAGAVAPRGGAGPSVLLTSPSCATAGLAEMAISAARKRARGMVACASASRLRCLLS